MAQQAGRDQNTMNTVSGSTTMQLNDKLKAHPDFIIQEYGYIQYPGGGSGYGNLNKHHFMYAIVYMLTAEHQHQLKDAAFICYKKIMLDKTSQV